MDSIQEGRYEPLGRFSVAAQVSGWRRWEAPDCAGEAETWGIGAQLGSHLHARDGAWHEEGGLSWQGLGHLQTSEVGAVLLASVPRQKEIHVILDNLSVHKSRQVTRFVADRPRLHFHFTPT